MHEFYITKESMDIGKEIYSLNGKSTDVDAHWRMRPTSVRAKPNSQILEWSPKLYLLCSTPEKDSLPKGTPKFHLFRRMTRGQKQIEQTPEELEVKLCALKKTASEAMRMSQADDEDRTWWDEFWAARTSTRERLGDADGDQCEPDVRSVELITELLWKEPRPVVVVEAGAGGDAGDGDDDGNGGVQGLLRDLEGVLTPRTEPAGPDEFGRSRAVGYVHVAQGEDAQERITEAMRGGGERTPRSDVKRTELFKVLQNSRGATEAEFAKTLQVRSI